MPEINRLRRQRQAARIHALGPRVLFELLAEIRAGADIELALVRYSALTRDMIDAVGAESFPPPLWLAA